VYHRKFYLSTLSVNFFFTSFTFRDILFLEVMPMSRFSDMLHYLRRREGLSQAELGEKLGIAKSTISMYERDERKPSFEMLEAIADFFNINMDTLAGNAIKPAPPQESELDAEFIRLWRQLTPEQAERELAYLRSLADGKGK
jgi:transcriptional regulator with XRE-family HTH domain